MVRALANSVTSELRYGLLRIVGGEGLSDLGQRPFAILERLAVGASTRRLGLGRSAAWLEFGAFLLASMVIMQSITQANDISRTALMMATIAPVCAPVVT